MQAEKTRDSVKAEYQNAADAVRWIMTLDNCGLVRVIGPEAGPHSRVWSLSNLSTRKIRPLGTATAEIVLS